MEKKAIIKLDKNYGNKGRKAWTIQESFNGKIDDPFRHKVLKSEYFGKLQEVVMDYLEEGFKVEIENQN